MQPEIDHLADPLRFDQRLATIDTIGERNDDWFVPPAFRQRRNC